MRSGTETAAARRALREPCARLQASASGAGQSSEYASSVSSPGTGTGGGVGGPLELTGSLQGVGELM